MSGPTNAAMNVGCAWLLLVGAGLLEIVWAVALKQADRLTRFWPSVIGVTAMVASGVIVDVHAARAPGRQRIRHLGSHRRGRRCGRGMLAVDEGTSLARIMCLALILSGVVGLRWLET